MAARHKSSDLARRLKEIEREKADVRALINEVRRWADAVPVEYAPRSEPRLRAAAVPESQLRETSARAMLEVEEREAADLPADET